MQYSTATKVLKMLREASSSLSGEEISMQLGLSRSAVWKAVDALRKEGYAISGVKNRGYELRAETQKLSQFGIESMLSSDWESMEVLVYEELESTNSLAKQKLGDAKSYLISAVSQTAGRGRHGRSFYSPAGSGLYFSLAFPWRREENPVTLTTMAAVAVARVLERTFAIEIGIKWVNDLFYKDKKICGILTEAVTNLESGQTLSLVVGVGINLMPPKAGFPEEIREKATFVTEGKGGIDPNRLIAEISNELAGMIKVLPSRAYLNEYRDRCFILGREVTLDSGKTIIPEDISEEGALVYREGGQLIELSSGEVRIKEY
ncbi:MAG: biotin--[acetyl-CoA-carboxylase] ligase [Clostridiaceae bacterium]|nr:biotin--[acetyl-CoA-carboxylase] ligase [Clostridiaceae bacterium]